MNPITADEVAGIRETVVGSMFDRGEVLSRSAGLEDDYGRPAASYSPGLETPCGFEPLTGREAMSPETQRGYIDARLRLPHTVTIVSKDRFRLTARFGAALAVPLLFEVAGVKPGPTCLVVSLVEVIA